jgi:hypothetical protein
MKPIRQIANLPSILKHALPGRSCGLGYYYFENRKYCISCVPQIYLFLFLIGSFLLLVILAFIFGK